MENKSPPDALSADMSGTRQAVSTLALRQQAEATFREKSELSLEELKAMSPEAVWQTLHELGVHQIELELQNEELRKSNERLQAAERVAGVGYLEWNLLTNGIVLSPGALDLYHLDSTATLDQLVSLVHPDDRERVERGLKAAVSGAARYDIDHRIVRPDGTDVHVQATAELFRNDDGQPVRLLGTIHDITERKRTEAALREKEQLLSESQRIAHIGGWFWAFAGPIMWTAEMYRLYGVSPETFTPTFEALANLVHPEDRPIMQEWVRACGAGEKPAELEFRCIWPDGKVRFLSGRGERICDAENRPTHIFGIVQDITQRKESDLEIRRATQAAQDSKELLDFALDAASIGDWSLDLITNRAHRSLRHDQCFGYTEAVPEWSYDTFLAHIQPMDRDRVDACFQKAMSGFGKYDAEFRTIWPDGSVHWLWTNGRFYFDDKGSPYRVAGIVSDVTERKLTTEALRNTQALLASAEKTGRVGGWEIDVQTRQTTWTEGVYDIYELDVRDRLTVDEGINYYTPASRPVIEQAVQGAIEQGEPFELELEIITAKGNRRSVNAVGKPDLSCGKISGFFQDITERKKAEAERQKFVMLAESSSEFIGMCDLDMNPFYVNPAGRRMVGLPDLAAACRVKVQDYYFPEDQRFIAEEFFPRVLQDGHGDVEIRLRHFQTGEPIWMFYYLFRVCDASGTPVGWATVSRDITERKRAEDMLAQSHSLLTNLARFVPGVIYQYRLYPDGRSAFPYASPGMNDIYEVTPEEVREDATPVFGRLHPDDYERVGTTIQESARTLQTFYCEFRVILPRQGLRWRWSQAKPERTEDGGTLWHGIISDITERKQAEASLSKSRTRLALATRAGGVGVWDYDVTANKLVWDDQMFQLYGITREQFSGAYDAWRAGVQPEDRQRGDDEIQAALRGEKDFDTEFRVLWPDGSTHYIRALAAVERDAAGQAVRMVGTNWDITERKKAEAAIESSLREKVALLNEVHHRVKNNLQVITSLLRMEARRSAHSTTKIVLDEMKNRVLSMALLHESLYRTGTFAAVDLGAYLKELTTQSFRASVVRPGSVRLQLELTSVQVEMDQALPCGLLVNELIANSLKHGFPGDHTGEVRVELQPIDGGPQLRLRVSDTGVGLPADFESKRGKSLGLQLVSDMAGQINGRLEVGPGPGAVFDVTFTPKHSEPNPSNLTASRLDGRSTR